MLIIYSMYDEVLVTTSKREKAMLKEWFSPCSDRNLDDYNRTESDGSAVQISTSLDAC